MPRIRANRSPSKSWKVQRFAVSTFMSKSLISWRSGSPRKTPPTAEAIRLAELVSKNFDSAASLRIRLGEQRALEARDITPEREDGRRMNDTLEQLRLKLLGPAEAQREPYKKYG